MKQILIGVFTLVTTCTGQLVAAQNNALKFDNDSYVQINDPAAPVAGEPFTIEAWVNISHNFQTDQALYWSNGGSNPVGLIINDEWGAGWFTINWRSGNRSYQGSSLLMAGNWHHVAIVYTGAGNELFFYIDGYLDHIEPLSEALRLPASQVIMGDNGMRSLNGTTVDELRIWDHARSSGDIGTFRNMQLPLPQPGLLRYYDFNEGDAYANNSGEISLSDKTGNSAGGQLNNFALSGSGSNWVGSEANISLPLKLRSFVGVMQQTDKAHIEWLTEEEENVSHFELLYSADASTWQFISKINARNKPGEQHYQFSHSIAKGSTHYYRLRMVDKDGKNSHSRIIKLATSSQPQVIIFPNPVTDQLKISLASQSPASLIIFNASGNKVLEQQLTRSQESVLISHLVAGVYMIQVSQDGRVTRNRVMKK